MNHRRKGQQCNANIDSALRLPFREHEEALIQWLDAYQVEKLAERVRKRAAISVKHQAENSREILDRRDDLIMMLYATKVPEGWGCAWCDGSSMKRDGQERAGIGGIVMDSQGTIISRISRGLGRGSAFTAELAALQAVIGSAIDYGEDRLWVYTDCVALARLWREHRADERLAGVREQVAALERFALHPLPRLHNQPANKLARQAAKSG